MEKNIYLVSFNEILIKNLFLINVIKAIIIIVTKKTRISQTAFALDEKGVMLNLQKMRTMMFFFKSCKRI